MKTIEPFDEQLADLQDGKPVSSRIANPKHAWEISRKFVREDVKRALRRSKVQGAFDGNAPKDPADMVRAGRANDSNLNFKRHRGLIMNAWTPLFDLVSEVPVCIDGTLEYAGPEKDAELMRGFAEYFHDMQFGWRGFDDTNQLCDLQMLLHGVGWMAWEDEYDWRPKAILAGNLYMANRTSASLDNCEAVMIETSMTAGELWRKISIPTQPGWNVEACKKAIMDSALTNGDLRQWTWQRWDQAFKNGDYYISQNQTKDIQMYILFVQEMDGTISQKIVPAKDPGSNDSAQFLFDSVSRYEGWDECLCLFAYDIGADGTYHSIKGLGTDIFPFCALLNNIDNSVADLVVMGIKPMWQPTTNAKMEDFKMAKWGGGNFIPNGIASLQVDMSRGIAPAVQTSQYFTQTLTQNTAASNQQELSAPTVEETAKSVMIRAAERAKISKGLYNRYMRAKSRQYAESWRRAVNPKLRSWHPGAKEALAFQARCHALCDKLGVEREALQKVINVRANRPIGMGSAALRFEIGDRLGQMALSGAFDEVGRVNAIRAQVATLVGHSQVDSYVPSLSTGREQTDDAAVAAQENNAFAILGEEAEVIITPEQDHVIHLQVHVPSMQKDMAACQQGMMEPEDCFKRLTAKGMHSEEHLMKLANNPSRKGEFKAFKGALDELAAYRDELAAELEQAAADAPPEEGEMTPEMAKVQGNLEIKAQKEQATMELRAQKQAFDQQLRAQQAEFDKALADAKAAAEINRATAESRTYTALDVAAQREKTASQQT